MKMNKKKKPKKTKPKKTKLHIAVKIHSAITCLVFVAYISSGLLLGPELLLGDMKNKYAFAADAVSLSLWIPGPPEVPVLSGYEQCDKGNLAIWLNWTASPDANSYDLYRNGEILISGISTNYYTDTNIEQNASYTYYVVAYGPLGNAQSNEAAVSTGICEPPPPPQPQCAIISFDGIDLTQNVGLVKTQNKTPSITGTTNLANAVIAISLYPGPIIAADTFANVNGYWYWNIPADLPLGSYVIYVTASDPDNQMRMSTTSLSFEIIEESSSDDDDHDHENKNYTQLVRPQGKLAPAMSMERKQGSVSVAVLNKEKLVFRGQELFLDVFLKNIGKSGSENITRLTYRIFDSKSKLLHELKEEIKITSDEHVKKNIKLPVFMGPGRYKISLFAQMKNNNFVAEDFFLIRDYPFIGVGGGILLTNETLVANLGWIFIILLLILLIFLILLLIEYWLYRHALRNVFDMDLEKEGFVTKRKEVLK